MHAPSSEGSSAEPNLTPLLDVVLQLLMFFIITTNFLAEEFTEDIKLPRAQSARPMDKSEVDVLFLNVLADGKVRVLGSPKPLSLQTRVGEDEIAATFWLKQQYEDAERAAKDKKVDTAIIIRAHESVDYAHVYELMRLCKLQGFRHLKLRAQTISGGTS